MQKHTTVALVAVLLASTAMSVAQEASSPYPRFQLVYQSDTRGYYRPCG